jgi:uncharacterized metal-binding protein YceD (DUF177 family)
MTEAIPIPTPGLPPSSEFSRPLLVGQIGALGTTRELAATPQECVALAKRFGLEALPLLSAVISIAPKRRGGGFLAEGRLKARARRVCVVSLEVFTESTDHSFALHFVTADRLSESMDAAETDEPDEIVYDGETIDLGEAIAEEYALALAPYPKKPGAKLVDIATEESSPFAALKDFKPSH